MAQHCRHMSMKNLIYLIWLMSVLSVANAQTGPGGVGASSSILTWLDASSLGLSNGTVMGVWSDISGNNNSFGQANALRRPTFLTNQINSLPAVDFDGGDVLLLPPTSDFDNQSDLTWFIVGETDVPANTQNLLSTTYAGGGAASFKWNSLFRSGGHQELIKNDNGAYVTRTTSGANTSPVIRSVALTGSSTDVMTRYVNGLLTHTASIAPFSVGTHAGSTIGRNSSSGNWFLDGRIAELVVFNSALNVAQIKIINNYLSSKYNIAISNDLYGFDATHGNDLAGIGQESGANQVDSRGNGIIRISNPSSLNNGDYLLWGHDGDSLTSQIGEIPAGFVTLSPTRLKREWVADLTNGNVGTVDMVWDISGFTLGDSISQYRIMVDADGDFSNGDILSITPTGNSDSITFTGVDLYTSGPYFTLVYSDQWECFTQNISSVDDWTFDPSNTWACGVVPDSTLDVTISSLTGIQVSDTQSCKDLIVQTNASLELLAGSNLIIKGNVEFQTGATITCAPTSTITFRRADGSIQLVENATAGAITFGNVVTQANPTVRFFGNGYGHTGGLHLVAGTAQNTGTWTFFSDATRTAHVAYIMGGSITGGDYEIQRFITGRAADWNTIAGFGLLGMTIEDIDDDIYISGIPGGDGNSVSSGGEFVSVWRFDNTTDAYVAPTNTSETMTLGTNGYEMWLGDNLTTWNAKVLDANNSSLNLSNTNITIDGAGGGWNLIGNPFPGYLNWDDIKSGYPIVSNAFWYYDADSSQYNFRNGTTFIPPGQGFWVNTNSSYTMQLTTLMLRSDLNTSEFFKTEDLEEFKIEVKGDSTVFGSAVRIRKQLGSFEGVDWQDIPPLKVPDSRAVNIWMDYAGEEMMVNYIDPSVDHVEIPMVVESGLKGDFTMNFKGLSKFRDFQCMNLLDLNSGEQIEIMPGQRYSISFDEGMSRKEYKLLLSKDDYEDCMAPADITEQQLRVFANGKEVVADFYLDRSARANIRVYDIVGNLVYSAQETVGYSRETMNLEHVGDGVYMINIEINGGVTTEKVILQ